METVKLAVDFLGNTWDFINSQWFVVRATPICMLIETPLTYVYFRYIRSYESESKQKLIMRYYWIFTVIKVLFLLNCLSDLMSDLDLNYRSRVARASYYYFFTIFVFIKAIFEAVKIYKRGSLKPQDK